MGLWITFFALGEGLFLHPWRQKRTLTELLSGRFCTKSVERLHEAVDNLWITHKKLWITYPQAPVDNFALPQGRAQKSPQNTGKWLVRLGICRTALWRPHRRVEWVQGGVVRKRKEIVMPSEMP